MSALSRYSLIKERINHYYLRLKYYILSPFYQSVIIPAMVKKVRKKKTITILFILNELGAWKTESLYLSMLSHPRFNATLLLVPAKETPDGITILKEYLDRKGYAYKEIAINRIDQKKQFKADIVFYQKPYDGVIDENYFYLNHLNSLFCYVLYCFRNRNYPKIKDIKFINFVWQFYAENEKVIEESSAVFCTKAKNMVKTGIPIMDDLLRERSFYANPWKDCGNKKRIIFAPHHTIESNIYEYATFLDYYDFMLKMVEKYKNKVQWAFKPHPVLKNKLYKVWGKEKTDDYYKQWECMSNTQLSSGEYMGLFKYSDAMIHDCGSFKLEYLYTGNPVMFLQKGAPVFDYTNWQTEQSLKLHYIGHNELDIEQFIINVINGEDILKNERNIFVVNYLTPPYNKTACQNIINAILGNKEYKDFK